MAAKETATRKEDADGGDPPVTELSEEVGRHVTATISC